MSALPLAIILSLARDAACIAPGVPAEYYVAVVQQESAADPLALHDDTPPGTPYHPATVDEAERIAKRLLAQGRSVGVGLGQLTARSEPAFEAKFGLSVHAALASPCANMRAGSALLQRGLSAALSTYNCGGPDCAPGYVRQVLARVPGVGAQGGAPPPAIPSPSTAASSAESGPSWDLLGQARLERAAHSKRDLIINSSLTERSK